MEGEQPVTQSESLINHQRFKRKNQHFIRISENAVVPLLVYIFDKKKLGLLQFERLLLLLKDKLVPNALSQNREYDLLSNSDSSSINCVPIIYTDESIKFAYHFRPTPSYSLLLPSSSSSSSSRMLFTPLNVTS